MTNIVRESTIDINDNTDIDSIINSIVEETVNPIINSINVENTNNNATQEISNDEQSANIENTQVGSEELSKTEQRINQLEADKKELLVNESTIRFSSAEWFQSVENQTVMLAGLGGIGGWTALFLSRLNLNSLCLIDYDKIDRLNLAGQFYKTNDVDRPKVYALRDELQYYSNYYKTICLNRKIIHSDFCKIMICGFDNMDARKSYFSNWTYGVSNLDWSTRKSCLFIDGRVSAEELQIFCITGDDEYNMRRYAKEFLFDDSESESVVCSYKQTTFMASMIASLITNLFVNFVSNLNNPTIERDLPFFTYYDAHFMYFKTEK